MSRQPVTEHPGRPFHSALGLTIALLTGCTTVGSPSPFTVPPKPEASSCSVVSPASGEAVSGLAVIELHDYENREHHFELCDPAGEECRPLEPEDPGEYPGSTDLFAGRAIQTVSFPWQAEQAPSGLHLLRVSCGEDIQEVPIHINRPPTTDFCIEILGPGGFRLDASRASDPDGPDESLRFSWSLDGEPVSEEPILEADFEPGGGPVSIHLVTTDEWGTSALSRAIGFEPDTAAALLEELGGPQLPDTTVQACLTGDDFIFEIGDGDDAPVPVAEEDVECKCSGMKLLTTGQSEVKKRYKAALETQSRAAAAAGAALSGSAGALSAQLAGDLARAADTINVDLGDKSGGLPIGASGPLEFACGHAFEVRAQITGTASACRENQGVRGSTFHVIGNQLGRKISRHAGPGGLETDFPLAKPAAGAVLNPFPRNGPKYGWDNYDTPQAEGKYYWPNEIRWYDVPHSVVRPFGIEPLPEKFAVLRQSNFVACVAGTDGAKCCCTWRMICSANATVDPTTLALTVSQASAKIDQVSCTP